MVNVVNKTFSVSVEENSVHGRTLTLRRTLRTRVAAAQHLKTALQWVTSCSHCSLDQRRR
jgi:hypothetical protein